VEGFAADAQVLIVTHQKRTMEIAGMMYGVSLNKDGTTKVVCQRMEQTQRAVEAAAREEAVHERLEAEHAVQSSADDEPVELDVPQGEPVG